MYSARFRHFFTRTCAFLLFSMGSAIALSYLWKIPYIYTLIGFSVWVFFNELVIDEDELISGGIVESDNRPISLPNLILKASVLCSLCFLALQFPGIRNLGT